MSTDDDEERDDDDGGEAAAQRGLQLQGQAVVDGWRTQIVFFLQVLPCQASLYL